MDNQLIPANMDNQLIPPDMDNQLIPAIMDNQLSLPTKSSEPIKRRAYSLDFKINVIKDLQSGKKTADVGRIYSLANSTVCSIWKDREKIMHAHNRNSPSMKRVRTPSREDIDLALFEWFKIVQSQDIKVTNYNLMAKADEIAESMRERGGEKFKCTNGWLSRFKGRHGIRFRELNAAHKQKNDTTSVDHDVSANLELELTTGEPEPVYEMATEPSIEVKEEPMTEPEDDETLPGSSTSTASSATNATSLSELFGQSSSSGAILGVPFADLPNRLSLPSSTLPSVSSEFSNSATNSGIGKNLLPSSSNPTNAAVRQAKVAPDNGGLEKNLLLPSTNPTNDDVGQPNAIQVRDRDQFDAYGEYIAAILRRMDFKTCAHVQKAFSDIIFDAEMGKYS